MPKKSIEFSAKKMAILKDVHDANVAMRLRKLDAELAKENLEQAVRERLLALKDVIQNENIDTFIFSVVRNYVVMFERERIKEEETDKFRCDAEAKIKQRLDELKEL